VKKPVSVGHQRLLVCGLAVFALIGAATVAQAEKPDGRIAVFVTAPERDGFIDAGKGTTDSVRDVQKRIASKRRLRLVRTAAEADITVRVLGRGAYSEQAGSVALPFMQGVAFVPRYATARIVTVRLEVGEYRKEFVGEDPVEWGDCAKQISEHVQAWVDANREMLMSRRAPK
jgi:hypothetical protein